MPFLEFAHIIVFRLVGPFEANFSLVERLFEKHELLKNDLDKFCLAKILGPAYRRNHFFIFKIDFKIDLPVKLIFYSILKKEKID
jgi:hypothetical protein